MIKLAITATDGTTIGEWEIEASISERKSTYRIAAIEIDQNGDRWESDLDDVFSEIRRQAKLDLVERGRNGPEK